MEEVNLIFIILSFLAGYLLKSFFAYRQTYSSCSILVANTTEQLMNLMGATVYRMSFVNRLYKNAIALSMGEEELKIHENEIEHYFNDWKKETTKIFMDKYPEAFRWQVRSEEWSLAMSTLTNLYEGRE